MTARFEYGKATNSVDMTKLQNILGQCFMMSLPEETDTYVQWVGSENFRIFRQEKEIVGGLAILPFSQYWGGKPVPMAGVAAVGIAPECRGAGTALAMMQNVVREIHSNGTPISVLFPAVQGLYRKVGYEQGGSFCNWEIKTESIQMGAAKLPLTPVSCESEILHRLYQHKAPLHNGNLERIKLIWKEITRYSDKSGQVYAYLIGNSNHPQGYIIFVQRRSETSDYIQVRDWVTLTPAAMQSFWAFLGSHRSQIDTIRWRGAMIDALTLILPEQTTKLKSSNLWMLRIVDVVKALEKRGYPQNVQAELHLEIQDELLAENNGKFLLSVTNGQGEVKKAGKGEFKLNIRALASLYTGLFNPSQLLLAGKLETTEVAIAAAAQIFAGASPWMADFF
jgi:predicted acetyltransferase